MALPALPNRHNRKYSDLLLATVAAAAMWKRLEKPAAEKWGSDRLPTGTDSSRRLEDVELEGWSEMDSLPSPVRSCWTMYPKSKESCSSSTSIVFGRALAALGGCGGFFIFRFRDFGELIMFKSFFLAALNSFNNYDIFLEKKIHFS